MNDEDSQKGHDINIRIFHITKNSTFGGRQFGSNVSNNYISFSNGGKRGEGQRPPPLCFYGKAGRLSQKFLAIHLSMFVFLGGGEATSRFFPRRGTTTSVFWPFFHLAIGGGSTSHASEQFLARQSTLACFC